MWSRDTLEATQNSREWILELAECAVADELNSDEIRWNI